MTFQPPAPPPAQADRRTLAGLGRYLWTGIMGKPTNWPLVLVVGFVLTVLLALADRV